MTTEFLHEHHEKRDHQAMARLSGHYSDGVKETYASIHPTAVTLYKLKSHTKHAPEGFTLTSAEVEALIEAWMQFQYDKAAWEAKEQERKNQEEQAEAERAAQVWLEIKALADSIPGLEILAREGVSFDWETGIETPITKWDARLPALGRIRTSIHFVDDVLEAVKDLVDTYNDHLTDSKSREATGFYGLRDAARQHIIDFLAEHRAFLAEKQEKEVVSAN